MRVGMKEAELEDLPEQNSRSGYGDFGRIGMQAANARPDR